MKNYSDFLSEVDAGIKASAVSLLEKTSAQLNGLPSVTCSSSNPEDEKLVRVVEIQGEEEVW